MLSIKNVCKEYKTGSLVQKALDGVSLSFRNREFVAILGPSGSGKTTLLNVIGGLDRYDSGEMYTDSVPTSSYGERDWDTYRNHTIGFIFQNYHLIPHQSLLSNVELAMTLSGVGREERRRRAMEALDRVGLAEQAQKKPNQLSGGQMQRVAIARALANEPAILLADEPTGALDSDTGEQVMELLKEVSRDHLVIMVTHNPELARRYATRIVRLKDGKITEDTDPADLSQAGPEPADLKPVDSKPVGDDRHDAVQTDSEPIGGDRRETAQTDPEPIGGDRRETAQADPEPAGEERTGAVQNDPEPVRKEQRDPEQTDREPTDLDSTDDEPEATGPEHVTERTRILSAKSARKSSMSVGTAFSLSVANLMSKKARTILVAFAASIGIVGIALILSLSNGANAYIRQMERDSLSQYPIEITTSAFSMEETMMTFAAMRSASGEMEGNQVQEQQMMGGMLSSAKVNDLASLKRWFDSGESGMEAYTRGIDYRYGIVPQIYQKGKSGYRQVNPDQTMASFGVSMDDSLTGAMSGYGFNEVFRALPENEQLYMNDYQLLSGHWPQKDTDCVVVLTGTGGIPDLMLYTMGLKDADALNEQIENVVAGKTSAASDSEDLDPLKSRVYDPEEFLGIRFRLLPACEQFRYDEKMGIWLDRSGDEKAMEKLLDDAEEMEIVGVVKPLETVSFGILEIGIEYPAALLDRLMRQAEESEVVKAQMEDSETDILSGVPFGENRTDTELPFSEMIDLNLENLPDAVSVHWDRLDQLETDDTRLTTLRLVRIIREFSRTGKSDTLKEMTDAILPLLPELIEIDEEKIKDVISFAMDEETMQEMFAARASSEISSYKGNLTRFGYADRKEPLRISIYPNDFESKNDVIRLLDAYNAAMEAEGYEDKVIAYTDYVGALMTSVTTIIDVITYVLIAFVAVSLVVSSIMIGIITYISVLERRKEIGILRAMGASRWNITEVFNAETFIIGALAGVFGIAVTLLLQIPINAIIRDLADQEGIRAFLPPGSGIILILLCIFLTFLGGFIPSRKAARQDPVEALRSE